MAKTTSREPRSSRPVTILVVDDDPEMQRLMLQKFDDEIYSKEYEFIFAQNGVKAIELLKERHIDLLITDIDMPEMGGIELVARTGTKLQNRAIMISGHGDMAHVRPSMRAGAFDYITKPLNFLDLRETIMEALEATVQFNEEQLIEKFKGDQRERLIHVLEKTKKHKRVYVEDIADVMDVTHSYVRYMFANNIIPGATKEDRKWYTDRDSFLHFMHSQTRSIILFTDGDAKQANKLRQQLRKKRIPGHKVGRNWVIDDEKN